VIRALSEAWRVFPWDPETVSGAPFSAGWIPPVQGQGRFDRPRIPAGVLYLAETPVHAVAEMIQHYRGQQVDDRDFIVSGHRLALVRAELAEGLAERLADLCDPATLLELELRPDETAAANRRTTQAISERIYTARFAGLRWWSALRGEWHTLVLFRDRVGRSALRFHEPEPLDLSHDAVLTAMRELGVGTA
jgi:hypothetical protein